MNQGRSHATSINTFMHRLQEDNHTTALEFAQFHPDIDFGMDEQFIDMKGFQNPFCSPDFDKIAFDEEYSFVHQAVAYGFGSETCNNILKHRRDRFGEIMSEDWDLYLSDSLFAVCGYGMAEISGKPHVMMHSTDLEAAQGSFKAFSRNYATFVPSNLPFTMLDFTVSKFQHRVWATYDWFGSFIFTAYVGNFAQKWALRTIIPFPYFSFSEYNRKSSFSFTDMPDSLFPPASRTNDFFSFGAYCKSSSNPLDLEFRSFIEDSKSKGTIIIAFGTFIDWRKAPRHYYETFSTVINQLTDFRVIWSMKGDRPSGLGKHVKTSAWVPQNQLLHHNKTVLFLSHGGLKSTKEAICSATPTIFVPMFGEQTRNSWLIQEKGFGRILSKFKINVKELGTHIGWNQLRHAIKRMEEPHIGTRILVGFFIEEMRPIQEFIIAHNQYVNATDLIKFIKERFRLTPEIERELVFLKKGQNVYAHNPYLVNLIKFSIRRQTIVQSLLPRVPINSVAMDLHITSNCKENWERLDRDWINRQMRYADMHVEHNPLPERSLEENMDFKFNEIATLNPARTFGDSSRKSSEIPSSSTTSSSLNYWSYRRSSPTHIQPETSTSVPSNTSAPSIPHPQSTRASMEKTRSGISSLVGNTDPNNCTRPRERFCISPRRAPKKTNSFTASSSTQYAPNWPSQTQFAAGTSTFVSSDTAVCRRPLPQPLMACMDKRSARNIPSRSATLSVQEFSSAGEASENDEPALVEEREKKLKKANVAERFNHQPIASLPTTSVQGATSSHSEEVAFCQPKKDQIPNNILRKLGIPPNPKLVLQSYDHSEREVRLTVAKNTQSSHRKLLNPNAKTFVPTRSSDSQSSSSSSRTLQNSRFCESHLMEELGAYQKNLLRKTTSEKKFNFEEYDGTPGMPIDIGLNSTPYSRVSSKNEKKEHPNPKIGRCMSDTCKHDIFHSQPRTVCCCGAMYHHKCFDAQRQNGSTTCAICEEIRKSNWYPQG